MAVGGAQGGPLWAGWEAPCSPGPPETAGPGLPQTGLPKTRLPSRERDLCQAGPGSWAPKSPAQDGLSPRHLHREPTAPPVTASPQVNWGARACSTCNEVSVALAKFNYGCICFLIFPRWFDLKVGKKKTPQTTKEQAAQ